MDYLRILHPKNRWKHLILEELPTEFVDGIEYRIHHTVNKVRNTGSCQCYKDCNCSDRAGEVTITKHKWFRRRSLDNTEKCFYSIPK